jgi:hypothetical protein
VPDKLGKADFPRSGSGPMVSRGAVHPARCAPAARPIKGLHKGRIRAT